MAGAACVVLGQAFFGIAWWMGVLAVVLTFLLSVVAARATGETDTTPIGAMGKITQLSYAAITPAGPKFLPTNLMTAAITAGAACHSSDLLQSLKTGYLVGANPRKQVIAQLLGIVIGVLVAVSVYSVIVKTTPFDPEEEQIVASKVAHQAMHASEKKDAAAEAAAMAKAEKDETIDEEFDQALVAYKKTTAAKDKNPRALADKEGPKTNLVIGEFNAPSVTVWKGVADLLASGVKNLPTGTPWGMAIGGILGIIISLLEEFLPKIRQMGSLGHGPGTGRRHHAAELVLDVSRLA